MRYRGLSVRSTTNLAHQPGVWGVKWDSILAGCEVDVQVWDRSTYLITVDGQHRTPGVSKVFEWFRNLDPSDEAFYPITAVMVLKHDTPSVVQVRL